MVSRYPNTGILNWKDQLSQDETTGKFTDGTPQSITVDCRLKPNGSGKFVPGTNEKVFSYLVMMPKLSIAIPDNSSFEVNGEIFQVIHGFTDQLRTQIWI